MAIARGAGTEIIRSAHFDDIDSTTTDLFIGVQHHIYTVLSVIVMAEVIQASGNTFQMFITGSDSKGGTSGEGIRICTQAMPVNSTFVWNDKFSFNGFEPTNFTGPMDDATKQDAIADQGGIAQYLRCKTSNAADAFEVTITYIDQNNA